MKKKKSWVLCFIVISVFNIILFPITYLAFLIIFALIFAGLAINIEFIRNVLDSFDDFLKIYTGFDIIFFIVVFSLFITIIVWCLLYRCIRVRKRAMMPSEFYRRPQIACKGTITEVHLENESLFGSTFFRPQWVLFETEDGKQIKAYRPMMWIGLLIVNFPTYSGSKGWLYYRQGKKFDNFEQFVNEDPLAEKPWYSL